MFIAAIAFITTFLLTPVFAKKLEEKGIVSKDLHKADERKNPEMVGLAVLTGFLISMLIAYAIYHETKLLATLVIVFFVGTLGIVDGLRPLTPLQKIVFLALIGAILIPYSTPIGNFYLIALPVFFMAACNFTNMLAGFNGLEIGTGAIASLAVAIVAYLNQEMVSFLIASTMFAALLAFLYFNKYPARVFPGDVGTLIVGAALFASIVFGRFEVAGGIIFIPYAIDAALKYFSAGIMTRESQTPTLLKGGKLYIPEGGNLSLPRLFIRKKPLRENEVVYRVWAVEAGFSILAILMEVLL